MHRPTSGLLLCYLATNAAAYASAPTDPPVPTEATNQPQPAVPPPEAMPRCLQLINEKKYAEARQILTPIVRDHPRWARALFYLGLSHHKEHRHEEAVGLFQRALEADPEYNQIKPYYGWSLYYLGRIELSRRMFDEVLNVRPDHADSVFALGLIDFDADRVDEAQARFLQAIDLARDQKDSHVEAKSRARLADVYVRQNRLEQAQRELERSIELNPDNHEPYFKLARVLQRLGDAEGAARMRELHESARNRRRSSTDDKERNPSE